MLVGGTFALNATNWINLARLNTNGYLDTGSNPGTGAGNRVVAVAVQTDGKMLIGGAFTVVHGTNRNYIARLNASGSLDASFSPGSAIDSGVMTSALQPDGKLLIGGTFTTVGGLAHTGLARLNANGSPDASFNHGPGANGAVYSVALQADEKVLIGRDHTYDGTNFNTLSRRNADGSQDSSFKAGSGASGAVRDIKVQGNGNILISGNFTTFNGVVRPYVARLYGDSASELNITLSGGIAVLSWPVNTSNNQLQESTNLTLPSAWLPVAQPPVTNGAQVSVTIPVNAGRKVFRLKSD